MPRVERLLLSSEPFPFSQAHANEVRVRSPRQRVDRIDAEMTRGYGSRAIAALCCLRALRAAG